MSLVLRRIAKGCDVVYSLQKKCGKEVGQVRFDPQIGFIKTMYLREAYRGQGYGQQMVDKVRKDSKTKDLFCVTYHGHPFWSKVPDARYHTPVDLYVHEGGYRFH